jgi:hypothetical protein
VPLAGVGFRKRGVVDGRYQRRSRDAASDENLDLSNWFLVGSCPISRVERLVFALFADLMGSWFRYDPKIVGKRRCTRHSRLGAIEMPTHQEQAGRGDWTALSSLD